MNLSAKLSLFMACLSCCYIIVCWEKQSYYIQNIADWLADKGEQCTLGQRRLGAKFFVSPDIMPLAGYY